MSRISRNITNIVDYKSKISKLKEIGLNRKQIAIRLGLSYQHVRSIERRLNKYEEV